MSNAPESRHLRLTLRTLLAWLDDTLPPEEVRQMGHQVSESQVAKELVERIQRVTRWRRLTIPPSTGADAVDPNVVAAYIDNELGPEQVAEFEKRCLNSDVHLAEVASAHQILSMIGQRAKVPPEARHRLYRLVRGRESINRDAPRAFARVVEPPPAFEVPRWGHDEPPPARNWSRWGLPLAALCLIALMAVSAWRLAPRNSPPAEVVAAAAAPAAAAPPVAPPAAPVQAAPEPAETEPVEKVAGDATPEPEAEPPAAVGAPVEMSVAADEGVALRWKPADRTWERLSAGAALMPGDRVVGLAPFRTPLNLGKLKVVLVGPAEIHMLPAGAEGTPHIEPVWGRVQVISTDGPDQVVIENGGSSLSVSALRGHRLGIEPFGPRADGSTGGLTLYATDGSPQLNSGKSVETLAGPGSIEFRPPDRLTGASSAAPPRWLSTDGPTEVERVAGTAFRSYFKPGTATTRALVEALEDDQESVRVLAAEALGALGQIDEVVFALDRPGDPGTRRTAAEVLRAQGARSEETDKAVAAALERFAGGEWAVTVQKLLDGYNADEAAAPETYKSLVQLLEHRDVAVRQLALDQLTTLTGRDSLGYDPDEPLGPGLKAWQELLRSGNLHLQR